LRRRPDRLLLREMVELAASVAIESGDRVVAVLSAAAAQCVRYPLPDERLHHAARADRVAADRDRARASAVGARRGARVNGGYITGGWSFVWAAYGWTALALASSGISLVLRLRKSR